MFTTTKQKIKRKIIEKKNNLRDFYIEHYMDFGELIKINETNGQVSLFIQINKNINKKNPVLVFENRKKEVIIEKKGFALENSTNLVEFKFYKSELKLEEKKKTYFLFLSIGRKRIPVRFIDDFDEKNSIDFFDTGSHLFFIRRDRHRRVFFKVGYLESLETVCDIPNFIHSIDYEDNQLVVSGSIYSEFLLKKYPNCKFDLLFYKSNGVYFKSSTNVHEGEYRTCIPIDKDTYIPGGKWKFSLRVMIDDSEYLFPCYVKRANEDNCLGVWQLPGTKETVRLKSIIFTGKISAQTTYSIVKLDDLTFKKDDGGVVITIDLLKSESLVDKGFLSAPLYFRLRQRENNDFINVPAQVNENGENGLRLSFKVEYSVLATGVIERPRRWDAYLSTKENGVFFNHRIKFSPENNDIDSQTESTFIGENDHYYSHFYLTKFNRLSFVYSRVPFIRNVEVYNVHDGKFLLDGIGYFPESYYRGDFTISIMLMNRTTEASLRKEAIRYNNNRFKLEIPIAEIDSIIESFKEIIDFYVVIEADQLYRELKIGLKKYDYYKDDVLLHFTSSKSEDSTIDYSLTITPKGNLKLETFQYDKEMFELIQSHSKASAIDEEVWLIGERPDTAQDNGLRFFEYCREFYPELQIYYVIDRDAKDVDKLEKYMDHVLFLGTKEHIEKSLIATKFLGTHDLDYILPFKGIRFEHYRKAHKIFLQHGVLGRKNVPYHKKYYKYPFDLFIVSSIGEKEMVEEKFGYDNGEVVSTGLARFDKLQENHDPKREILLIPTWREWIVNEERLINSTYYKKYISLITSPVLLQLLEKHDLYLNFYPHYRMQEYILNNVLIESERICFIQLGEKTVQDLLKDNSLMITDFSSVSFDFTYLGKPVIYYHFDQDLFFKDGILRPIEETFLGDIISIEEDLLKKIEQVISRDFKEREDIARKRHLIFSVQDKHNNSRIINEIIKLDNH